MNSESIFVIGNAKIYIDSYMKIYEFKISMPTLQLRNLVSIFNNKIKNIKKYSCN